MNKHNSYEILEKIKEQIHKLDEVFIEDILLIEIELQCLQWDNETLRDIRGVK